MYRHKPLIIGASLIALSASAAATSMASVSYGPITVQLIDLDLGDGIKATLNKPAISTLCLADA